jgi:hypothetical protein
MDTDLVLTVGIVLLVLSIPSLLSAWAESRVPRIGALMVLVACGMILTALQTAPGGYTFESIPGVMIGVISRLFN